MRNKRKEKEALEAWRTILYTARVLVCARVQTPGHECKLSTRRGGSRQWQPVSSSVAVWQGREMSGSRADCAARGGSWPAWVENLLGLPNSPPDSTLPPACPLGDAAGGAW